MSLPAVMIVILCLFTGTLKAASAVRQSPDSEIVVHFDDSDTLSGKYWAVLAHDGTNFYQFAELNLRAVSSGDGHLKISANVKVYLGDWNSNEYLTYEYDNCPFNLITRQITIRSEKNDISLIGNVLQGGVFDGKWFASTSARTGTFSSSKKAEPSPPPNGQLVRALTGYYRGSISITNPEVNLPEKISMSFVSTQDTATTPPSTKISGKVRFYLGDYDGHEFEELKFADVQFNFYSRYLTAKTETYGITIKGTMAQDGAFSGVVLTDSNGQVGTINARSP